MENTFTGRHKAVVKETGKGTPYISFELIGGPLTPDIDKASIGMILAKDTDFDSAHRIADLINEKLVGLYITNF
ncbi:MAG TPA: hypothetical protein DCO79_01770 [Spirochaeta sp.]|nr:hypothetical protein [Spirochaeta sp.]